MGDIQIYIYNIYVTFSKDNIQKVYFWYLLKIKNLIFKLYGKVLKSENYHIIKCLKDY